MSVPVIRYKRRKRLGDDSSPSLFYLKRKAGTGQVVSLKDISLMVERMSSLSSEDVMCAVNLVAKRLKAELAVGNSVKIDGIGLYTTTFNCIGTEEEKDCTVRNINQVNIRFKACKDLRLGNETTQIAKNTGCGIRYHTVADDETSANQL